MISRFAVPAATGFPARLSSIRRTWSRARANSSVGFQGRRTKDLNLALADEDSNSSSIILMVDVIVSY
jgi:hypothetical protein